jgi:carbamoyl-phosphate synthase small subunit
MVGNYGVPSGDLDEYGLPKFFESKQIQVPFLPTSLESSFMLLFCQISGLIISEYSSEYSHWNAVQSLGQWLSNAGVPALYGIDTRRLTKKIRVHGSLLGKIEFPEQPISIIDPNRINLVAKVSTPNSYTLGPEDSEILIIAFDCGMKLNILRHFVQVYVSFFFSPSSAIL